MEGAESLLDAYVLALADRPNPRVCYLGTAMGDAAAHIVAFYRAFPLERADATHLPLFERDGRDPRDHLLAQDVIYVGGGNTVNMLAMWRAHGVDVALREAWEAGVVLCGMSAGSLCWFEAGVTDSYGPLRPLHDGLGLLPAATAPTTTARPSAARPTVARSPTASRRGSRPTTAAPCTSSAPSSPRSSRRGPDARAYRVEPGPLGAVETPIAARFLGA